MSLNWKQVMLDVVIIFALTAAGGFLVGVLNVMGISFGTDLTVGIAVSNLILICAGFAYSSYKVRSNRWAHLTAVGGCLWILSLVNVLFKFATIGEWIIGIVPIIIFIGFGGGIGAFIAEKTRNA